MAIAYNADIVREGLILHVDPANIKSYPGTGTAVTNLADTTKNGTFQGGTAYNSSNRGTFYFDGINSVINFGIGSDFFPMLNFSFDIWFSSDGTTPTTGTSPALLGFTYGLRLFVNSTNISVGIDNGTGFSTYSSPSTYSFHDSSWHHVVYGADSGNIKVYIDGQSVISDTVTSWSGTTRWPTNSVNFGRDNNNTPYFFRGKMGPIKVYNKLLSATDVKNNYNAIRGRYAI